MLNKINFVGIIIRLLGLSVSLAEKEKSRLSKKALKHMDAIDKADGDLQDRFANIQKLKQEEMERVRLRAASRRDAAALERKETVEYHKGVLKSQGDAHDRLMAALNPIVVVEAQGD